MEEEEKLLKTLASLKKQKENIEDMIKKIEEKLE